MAHTWDPDRYLAYADERGRPFVELIARIDAASPGTVVDLGCGPGNLTSLVADRRSWTGTADVLVSNATLQWVPDHLDLLPRLVAQVTPGGWFAFQVPGNFDEPSHTIRTELTAQPPYAAHTDGVA